MAARSLNPTAASLLGFLHDGPSSGWDLLARARLVIGRFWSLTSSQVYRELTALDHDGLIRAGKSGPRDRRPYELTAAGRAAFAEWIRQPPGEEQIRYPLLLTLSFGRHVPPEALREFAAVHRDAHAQRLAGYLEGRRAAETTGQPDPYAMATLDFGIRYEQAVLDWFAHLAAEVGGPPRLTPTTPRAADPETTRGGAFESLHARSRSLLQAGSAVDLPVVTAVLQDPAHLGVADFVHAIGNQSVAVASKSVGGLELLVEAKGAGVLERDGRGHADVPIGRDRDGQSADVRRSCSGANRPSRRPRPLLDRRRRRTDVRRARSRVGLVGALRRAAAHRSGRQATLHGHGEPPRGSAITRSVHRDCELNRIVP